ncbi:MAG TPA: hypothetical protein EYP10_05825, partial [Armatimonadetes bacterium]|nr:hypothetical protein [Armatimonadota bacterium]
ERGIGTRLTQARVAVLRTSPETVIEDYARLMRLVDYTSALPKGHNTILKINISWHYFYPACSTTPWQLEGVIKTMLEDGYPPESLIAAQNRTVVVNPEVGAIANKHNPVLNKYGVRTIWLYKPDVEWIVYEPRHPMLVLDKIFPKGITIPKFFIGMNAIHLPAVKCVHGDTLVTLSDGRRVRIGEWVEEQLKHASIALIEDDGDVRIRTNSALIGMSLHGEVVSCNAMHIWRTPMRGKDVFRIRTKTGREVIVSSEHPFLTPKGWCRACELRVGDRIAIVRKLKVHGSSQPLPRLNERIIFPDVSKIELRGRREYDTNMQREICKEHLHDASVMEIAQCRKMRWQTVQLILNRYSIPTHRMRDWIRTPQRTSRDFWRWMGYVIAKGWIQPMNMTYRLWWEHSDPAVQKHFIKLTHKLFGLIPTKHWRQPNTLYVDSVQLCELLQKLGLRIPLSLDNKRVPELLFKCPDEEIAAFIEGYFDCNAGIGAKDGLHVVTESKQ